MYLLNMNLKVPHTKGDLKKRERLKITPWVTLANDQVFLSLIEHYPLLSLPNQEGIMAVLGSQGQINICSAIVS